MELDASLLEVVQHVDKVAQAAAQPVELPHNQRIACRQGFQATGEGRAVDVRTRHLVLEHGLASGLLQGGELHGRILVFGADAGVAVFHAPLIGLTYRIRKPLFSLAEKNVQKLTFRWTPKPTFRIRNLHQKSPIGSIALV